ncbi:antibiotic biosynthesis monooxygenase [Streptomyces sp. T-3]|nr:antibiotic biosynthesis monooxygenase [Streptomyces sp. T-3]
MSVVETVKFKLEAGFDTAVFAKLDEAVEDGYMAKQPGFVSREVTRNEDGEYLVIVHWATPEEADATMGAFFGRPETQEFLAAIDKSTVSSGRYIRVER